MRRVNQDWIVLDNPGNTVGFMRSDSLVIVPAKLQTYEGFLKGCLGLEHKGKKYIYLLYSSGELVLLDGLSFHVLSTFKADDSQ